MKLNLGAMPTHHIDSGNTLPNTLVAVDGKQLIVHVHLFYIG